MAFDSKFTFLTTSWKVNTNSEVSTNELFFNQIRRTFQNWLKMAYFVSQGGRDYIGNIFPKKHE
jgi:hypothetical protein